MPTNEFGTLLRSIRTDAGMSVAQLAGYMGISTPYLSDVELGRRGPLTRPRIFHVARLLHAEPAGLLRAAAAQRGHYTLSTRNVSPLSIDVGAILARDWLILSDAQLSKILEILGAEQLENQSRSPRPEAR